MINLFATLAGSFHGNYNPTTLNEFTCYSLQKALKKGDINTAWLIKDVIPSDDVKYITLECNGPSILVPESHPLVGYIIGPQTYKCSRRALELIVILFDKSNRYHHIYFTDPDHEKELVECVCCMLDEIVKFANAYKIEPLFTYIGELLQFQPSRQYLYPCSVTTWQCSGDLREKLRKVITIFKKLTNNAALHVETEFNYVINNSIRTSWDCINSLIHISKMPSDNTSTLKGKYDQLWYVMSYEARNEFNNEVKDKIDLNRILTSVASNTSFKLTSKFLNTFLRWRTTDFNMSNVKPHEGYFKKLTELELPPTLKKNLDFNLMLLSSAEHYTDNTGHNTFTGSHDEPLF